MMRFSLHISMLAFTMKHRRSFRRLTRQRARVAAMIYYRNKQRLHHSVSIWISWLKQRRNIARKAGYLSVCVSKMKYMKQGLSELLLNRSQQSNARMKLVQGILLWKTYRLLRGMHLFRSNRDLRRTKRLMLSTARQAFLANSCEAAINLLLVSNRRSKQTNLLSCSSTTMKSKAIVNGSLNADDDYGDIQASSSLRSISNETLTYARTLQANQRSSKDRDVRDQRQPHHYHHGSQQRLCKMRPRPLTDSGMSVQSMPTSARQDASMIDASSRIYFAQEVLLFAQRFSDLLPAQVGK
jgi:hypothetical protein